MGRRGRPGRGMGAGPAMRGGRRRGGKGGLGEKARALLKEAREHAERGEHAEAAALFSRMAGVARERGMPRMASTLAVRAAQCQAKIGDREGLIASTEAAIGDAKREGDSGHAARNFGDLLSSLQGTAFASASPEIEGAIRSALGVSPDTGDGNANVDVNRSMRRHMPSECDACGAPVSSEGLRFNESGHADCPLCGTVLTS